MRIFLYECISAGALGADVPPSLRREGWAMLAALVEDFQCLPDVETFTLIDDKLPGTLGDVCSRVRCADEAEQFRAIAARCDWTLVIAPEFDDLLLDRSRTVVEAGGRLLGSSLGAIHVTGDKLATATLWDVHGVPHPTTSLTFVSPGPPWVIKPRHGAGSQATFLIRDDDVKRERWSAAWQEWPRGDLIVQQYIAGEPASVALLIGPTQTIALLPARQHLSDDGRFRYEGGSVPLPESLAQRSIRLATSAVACVPGLRGYVGVDLVLGEQDWAIEINPRLTTSYIGLRQVCRQNLAELMLRCVRGETIETPAWSSAEVRFGKFV